MYEKNEFLKRLELIHKIYFNEEDYVKTISDDRIFAIEKKLNISIPEPLKIFYLLFGEKEKFLNCMYKIIPLEQLKIENKIVTIAVENQGVCSYGWDIKSNKIVYFMKGYIEEIKLDIEDFILYLLAIQGTGFFSCVAQMDISEADLLDRYFFKISKVSGQYSVYCYHDKIIGFISKTDVFLSAKSDDIMNEVEKQYNLPLNYC